MWIFTVVALALSVTLCHAEDSSKSTIEGKLVMVTGAARGIGEASADRFLEKGASLVVIVDKLKEEGEKTTKELNDKYGDGKVVFYHGDVTTDVKKIYEDIKANYGIPDIMFNNAGIVDENNPEAVIQTNLLAIIKFSELLYEDARMDKGGKGCTIVNMSDMYAYVIDPFLAILKAVSSGCVSWSRTMGHPYRFSKTGVNMMSVCPGFANTSMTDVQMEKDEYNDVFYNYAQSWKWQSAHDIALAVISVCEEGESGKTYTIDGGEWFESPYSEYYSSEDIEKFEGKSNTRYNMF